MGVLRRRVDRVVGGDIGEDIGVFVGWGDKVVKGDRMKIYIFDDNNWYDD